MGADVAHHQRRAAALRVEAPGQGAARRRVAFMRFAALHVLDLNQADGAELSGIDHRPGLPHHRVAGVVVGQAEHDAGGLHPRVQCLRFGECVGHRLVADHVEAEIDGSHRVVEVAVVRGHDRHHFRTVRTCGFGLQHRQRVGMYTLSRQADLGTGRSCALRVRRQHTGDQLVAVVQPRRLAVHRTDEGAGAAADHGQSQASAQHGNHRVQAHRILRIGWFAAMRRLAYPCPRNDAPTRGSEGAADAPLLRRGRRRSHASRCPR